jgi:DNA-binding CsgD family transcriptional regulator
MHRVTQRDLQLVSQCGHDILEARNEDDLRECLIQHWLPKLIDTDFAACNEFSRGVHQRVTSNVSIEEIRSVLEPFAAHIHEHPCYTPQAEQDVVMPLKISDFMTRRQLHRLGLYQEVYKHLHTEYQMVMSLKPCSGDMVALVLSNSHRDYTERDRVVLALLQPAIQRAYATMRQRRLLASLSTREAEVLSWVAEAKTNKEIALILGISPRTVQKHLESIFSKIGVETRTAAALWAPHYARPGPNRPAKQAAVLQA